MRVSDCAGRVYRSADSDDLWIPGKSTGSGVHGTLPGGGLHLDGYARRRHEQFRQRPLLREMYSAWRWFTTKLFHNRSTRAPRPNLESLP